MFQRLASTSRHLWVLAGRINLKPLPLSFFVSCLFSLQAGGVDLYLILKRWPQRGFCEPASEINTTAHDARPFSVVLRFIHARKFISSVYLLLLDIFEKVWVIRPVDPPAAGGCVGLILGDTEAFRAALPAFAEKSLDSLSVPLGGGAQMTNGSPIDGVEWGRTVLFPLELLSNSDDPTQATMVVSAESVPHFLFLRRDGCASEAQEISHVRWPGFL